MIHGPMTTRSVDQAVAPRHRLLGVPLAPLRILEYHGIHADPTGPGLYNSRYSVDVDEFARQLDWLRTHGFRTRLLDDQPRSPNDVVLTFDDGDASAAAVALPLLAERGMVGEFFISSDLVDQPGYVTHRAIRELTDDGMGIQSHGRTHRQLSTLSSADAEDEAAASKDALEQWTGRPVSGLALPGGRGGHRELSITREVGYEFVLNSFPGINRHHRDSGYLHRVAVTRTTTLPEFVQLVRWRGPAAPRLLLRTAALEVPKFLLGDSRYDRLRSRLSGRDAGRGCPTPRPETDGPL